MLLFFFLSKAPEKFIGISTLELIQSYPTVSFLQEEETFDEGEVGAHFHGDPSSTMLIISLPETKQLCRTHKSQVVSQLHRYGMYNIHK